MDRSSLPILTVWIISIVLSFAGLLNVMAPRWLRRAYAYWDFPSRFYLTVALLQFAAAMSLAIPELRLWGIALTGMIMFGAIITLLTHRHYVSAVPAMVIMLALVPAALTLPAPPSGVHYVENLPAE